VGGAGQSSSLSALEVVAQRRFFEQLFRDLFRRQVALSVGREEGGRSPTWSMSSAR
jgi:hypothetical protein